MYYYKDLLVPCHNQSIFIRYLKGDREPFIFPPLPQQTNAFMDQGHVSELIHSMVNSLNQKAAHHPSPDRPAFDITLEHDAEPSVILSKIPAHKRPKRRGKCPRLAPRDDGPFKRVNYIDRSKSLNHLKYSAAKPIKRPKKPKAYQKGDKVGKPKETADNAEPFVHLNESGHHPDWQEVEESVQTPDLNVLNQGLEEILDLPSPPAFEEVNGQSDGRFKETEDEKSFPSQKEVIPIEDHTEISGHFHPEVDADHHDLLYEEPHHGETLDSEQDIKPEKAELTIEFDHGSDQPHTEHVEETADLHYLETESEGINEYDDLITDDISDEDWNEPYKDSDETSSDVTEIECESFHEDNSPSTETAETVDHILDEAAFAEPAAANESESLTIEKDETDYASIEEETVEESDGTLEDPSDSSNSEAIENEESIDHSFVEETVETDYPFENQSNSINSGPTETDESSALSFDTETAEEEFYPFENPSDSLKSDTESIEEETEPGVDDDQDETFVSQEIDSDILPSGTLQHHEEPIEVHPIETEANENDFDQDLLSDSLAPYEDGEPDTTLDDISEEQTITEEELPSLIEDHPSIQHAEIVEDSTDLFTYEETVVESADSFTHEETDISQHSDLDFNLPEMSAAVEEAEQVEPDLTIESDPNLPTDNSIQDEDEKTDTTFENTSKKKTIIVDEFNNQVEDTLSIHRDKPVKDSTDPLSHEESDTSQQVEVDFKLPETSAVEEEAEDDHPGDIVTDTTIEIDQDLSPYNGNPAEDEEPDVTLEDIFEESPFIEEHFDNQVEDTHSVQYEESVADEVTPSIQHEESVADEVTPSIQLEEPVADEDTPSIQHEESVADEVTPSIQHEEPAADEVTPSIQHEEPAADEVTPSIQHEESVADEVTPSIQLEEPVADEVTPSIQHEESVADEVTPSIQLEEPVADEVTPSIQHEESVADEVTPSIQLEEPVVEEDTPSIQLEEPVEDSIDPFTQDETDSSQQTDLDFNQPEGDGPDTIAESGQDHPSDQSMNDEPEESVTAPEEAEEEPIDEDGFTGMDDDFDSVVHEEEESFVEETGVSLEQDAASPHNNTPDTAEDKQESAPAESTGHTTSKSNQRSQSEDKEIAGDTSLDSEQDEDVAVEESYTTILNKYFTLGDKINVYAGSKLLDKQGTFLTAGRDFFIWIDGDGYVRLQVICGGISIGQKKRKK
ncbi:hypothetical protein [Rossellomorea sp. NS-SX7]|uniref:hypothetical protein n=1 Tax=Rossellomorea sp. NS-SX7 TaxID=3463856 RepID=UPI004058F933